MSQVLCTSPSRTYPNLLLRHSATLEKSFSGLVSLWLPCLPSWPTPVPPSLSSPVFPLTCLTSPLRLRCSNTSCSTTPAEYLFWNNQPRRSGARTVVQEAGTSTRTRCQSCSERLDPRSKGGKWTSRVETRYGRMHILD